VDVEFALLLLSFEHVQAVMAGKRDQRRRPPRKQRALPARRREWRIVRPDARTRAIKSAVVLTPIALCTRNVPSDGANFIAPKDSSGPAPRTAVASLTMGGATSPTDIQRNGMA
jgi:alkylated DNA repair dioxygenase AlkB